MMMQCAADTAEAVWSAYNLPMILHVYVLVEFPHRES
jgi:hypothetical protein